VPQPTSNAGRQRGVSRTGSVSQRMTSSCRPTEAPIPGLRPGGSDIDCWKVVAQEPIVIPPLSAGLVIGKIEKGEGMDLPQEVLIEP
jgi:hypothetical protein